MQGNRTRAAFSRHTFLTKDFIYLPIYRYKMFTLNPVSMFLECILSRSSFLVAVLSRDECSDEWSNSVKSLSFGSQ